MRLITNPAIAFTALFWFSLAVAEIPIDISELEDIKALVDNKPPTDADNIIIEEVKKSSEQDNTDKNAELPQDAFPYSEDPNIPYAKRRKVVKHVLGREGEIFQIARQKIKNLPTEERQQFAELLEIISRYVIIDLSKSSLPDWMKKLIFMTFGRKYLSNFAIYGSHEGPSDGVFPPQRRFNKIFDYKKDKSYVREDKNQNFECALCDFALKEILKMLSDSLTKEVDKIKVKNTSEELLAAGGDEYYIPESDLIELIVNSSHEETYLSQSVFWIYCKFSNMGTFIDLVEQFNAKLSPKANKKDNFVPKNTQEKKKSTFSFRGQNIKTRKTENNQKLGDIFAKKPQISKSYIASVAPLTHFDFTFSRQWRAFLRHLSKLQKIEKEDSVHNLPQINKNKHKIIVNNILEKKSEYEIEPEEEEISISDLKIKLNQVKVDPESITNKSYKPIMDKITKSLREKSSIIGFSLILSFLYLVKNLILQLIKGVIKYCI